MDIKNTKEIKLMKEGGERLAFIKNKLKEKVKEGTTAYEIEKLASSLIAKSGGQASFKMVNGYSWATCINLNEGVVHGIPKKTTIFKKGDLVSVDVGLFYKGFHTDTSFSIGINPSKEVKLFLEVGMGTLKKAVKEVYEGNHIYDISVAIENSLLKNKLTPIRALVGHGVGRNLHEDPQIPCFSSGTREKSPIIKNGATLAIEVMYSQGSHEIEIEADGWTISTQDGKLSALFEETVAVTADGPVFLTL